MTVIGRWCSAIDITFPLNNDEILQNSPEELTGAGRTAHRAYVGHSRITSKVRRSCAVFSSLGSCGSEVVHKRTICQTSE